MQEAFLEVDVRMRRNFQDRMGERSGCTAIAVMITPSHIVCANAGDSRALLCRNGDNVELSHDHKPFHDEEKSRIEVPRRLRRATETPCVARLGSTRAGVWPFDWP